jgi:ribosomal protein S18 acetylase RimI-like enzyme
MTENSNKILFVMTPSLIHIRQFQFPQDYPQVLALWSAMEKGVHVGRSDTPGEIEKKLARDPDLFLVAECEDRIVGSVIGGYDGRRGMVYHLAVDPSFRGQGVGSQLMDEVESRLRARGCLKSYLLVAEDNHDVDAFYRKQGWKHMDTVHLFGKELQ